MISTAVEWSGRSQQDQYVQRGLQEPQGGGVHCGAMESVAAAKWRGATGSAAAARWLVVTAAAAAVRWWGATGPAGASNDKSVWGVGQCNVGLLTRLYVPCSGRFKLYNGSSCCYTSFHHSPWKVSAKTLESTMQLDQLYEQALASTRLGKSA